MKIHFILGLAIISLGSVSTAAETSTDPGIRFIQAADTGDAVGMTVNLTKDVLKAGGGKLKPEKFLEMIKPCYLRRLY